MQKEDLHQRQPFALPPSESLFVSLTNILPDPDPDVTVFLVSEMMSDPVLATSSASSLTDLLAEHISQLTEASPEEAQYMCEQLYNELLALDKRNRAASCDAAELGSDSEEELSDHPTSSPVAGVCELCERPMPLTFHHLIPRATHKKLLKRGLFTKQEMCTRGVMLCRPCHSAVHRQFDHLTLALEYNSIEKLLEHEGIIKWAAYASKQRCVRRDHALRGLKYGR
ncbi:hypothetical protein HK104_004373 [Borealophlyctis nickersoniae]|nr:hypothetical protein HK104_004373 [Borealophlyctis nickersoniae]